ncbi:MAG: hypothetical protein J5789_02865, partial [Oscillospiraceae bacterium]|nr:hypothetical protein [Oscillospiraceae bacterium]
MNKRFISLLLAIAMVAAMFSGVTMTASAEEADSNFVLADSIEAGDKIMFVYPNASAPKAAGPITGNNGNTFLSSVNAAITEDVVTSETALVFEVEEGTAAGTYAFKYDGKYLAPKSSGNYVVMTATEKSTETDWTVTFSSGEASVVRPEGSSGTRYLRYNTSSPRFTSYGNTNMAAISIYKLEVSQGDDSPEDIDVYFVDGTNSGTPYVFGYKDGDGEGPEATSEDLSYPGGPFVEPEGQEMNGFDYYKLTLNVDSVDRVMFGNGTGAFSAEATANHTAPLPFITDAVSAPEAMGGNRFVVYLVKIEDGVMVASKQDDVWPVPSQVIQEATCTEDGAEAFVGLRTGAESEVVAIPALGHDWGEWTQTAEPTCTEAGEETRICARCDAVETRDVDPLGHDYQDVVTDPTCTEAGYTTHTCSISGDSYPETPVTALGHDWGEWTQTAAPTCTEAGEETRSCSRCDATETRPVEAQGHDYQDVVTDPTCTEAGYTTHTCSICGDTYTDTPVDALGHNYQDVVTDPT